MTARTHNRAVITPYQVVSNPWESASPEIYQGIGVYKHDCGLAIDLALDINRTRSTERGLRISLHHKYCDQHVSPLRSIKLSSSRDKTPATTNGIMDQFTLPEGAVFNPARYLRKARAEAVVESAMYSSVGDVALVNIVHTDSEYKFVDAMKGLESMAKLTHQRLLDGPFGSLYTPSYTLAFLLPGEQVSVFSAGDETVIANLPEQGGLVATADIADKLAA